MWPSSSPTSPAYCSSSASESATSTTSSTSCKLWFECSSSLSDGRAYQKNVIVAEAVLKNMGKTVEDMLFTIVRITKCGPLLNKQTQKGIRIEEAELVSAMYKTQLGNPIAYDVYLERTGETPEFAENSGGRAASREPVAKGQPAAQTKKPEPPVKPQPQKRLSEPKGIEESKSNSNSVPYLKPGGKPQTFQGMNAQTRDNSVGKSNQPEPKKTGQNQQKQPQRSTSNPPIVKIEAPKK